MREVATRKPEIKLNGPAFKRLINDPRGVVAADLRGRGRAIVRQARSTAPHDTGRLDDGIVADERVVKGKFAIEIRSTAENRKTGFPYGALWERRLHYLRNAVKAGKGDHRG